MEKKLSFKNQKITIRDKHQSYYTCISNKLAKDSRLEAADKGIMLMILSDSDDFVLNIGLLEKESNMGTKSFNKSIKRLKQFGYLHSKRIQSGVIWTIVECPPTPDSITVLLDSIEMNSIEMNSIQKDRIINTNTTTTNLTNTKNNPTEVPVTLDQKKNFSDVGDVTSNDIGGENYTSPTRSDFSLSNVNKNEIDVSQLDIFFKSRGHPKWKEDIFNYNHSFQLLKQYDLYGALPYELNKTFNEYFESKYGR